MAGFDHAASEAGSPGRVDVEKIGATTQHDIAAQMTEDGEDPGAPFAHYTRVSSPSARPIPASDAAPSRKHARRRKRAHPSPPTRTA